MANIERNYKDNVFCMLYRDKENLLSLYNAVNGTEYRDAEGLKVVTLEQAICARMHNDAAFIIGTSLNLYEQQSTVSDNIPLRNLYYIAEELKQLVPTKQLYGRKAVRIPVPRFVVFYNGKEEQPEEKVLKLSDLYEVKDGEGETELDLELVVRQININSGHSADILRKCESLKGYMTLVDKVREKREAGQDIKSAVTEAVDECIREGVLSEFFREHRSEVIEMGIYEIDDETFEQVIREESWEEGCAKGKIEDILDLLEDLGPIPEELRKTVMTQQDLDILKNWFKLAAKVESVEEFQKQYKIHNVKNFSEHYIVHEQRSEVTEKGAYEIDDKTFEQVIRREGELVRLITLIQKKVAKGKSLAQIAEETEETEESIRSYYEAVCAAPEMTAEQILRKI